MQWFSISFLCISMPQVTNPKGPCVHHGCNFIYLRVSLRGLFHKLSNFSDCIKYITHTFNWCYGNSQVQGKVITACLERPLLQHNHSIDHEHSEYIYVICRPGGPYWEKLCPRSWVRPKAAGRAPCSRPRAQFFPIRTDLGRQIACLFFSLWKITLHEIFVFIFYWSSFTPCACVWSFGQANPRCLQRI